MPYKLKTILGWLRLVALLEGISYLLFIVTVPLKYGFDITTPNYIVGMAHGVLFLAYGALVLANALEYRWGFNKTVVAGICGLLPAGTFYADYKIFKPLEKQQANPENSNNQAA